MKKLLPLIIFVFVNVTAISQINSDFRPVWTKSVPNPPAGANYFFSWGMGEGYDQTQAINNAWTNALNKSLHELGVIGITQQDIDAVAINGIDAVVAFNKVKRRLFCTTDGIPLQNNRIRIYVLIQVQRDIYGKDDFYEPNPNSICSDLEFDKKIKEMNCEYDFSARVFVPGMAQIQKGCTGKGIGFIVGQVVTIGGIVTCEGLRATYVSKINTTKNPQQRQQYIDNAANMELARNICIAGAAAVYVWNVIDGIAANKKKKCKNCKGRNHIVIVPYASPNNQGVALNYKF